MGRKAPIDIETLLRWAYREELPKREIGGLTGWESDILLLGTRVDDSYKESGEPGFPVAMGPPHPDALLIDHCVRQMEDVELDWAGSRDRIMGHLAPYAPLDHPALRYMRFSPQAIITMHARMGTRPVWDLGRSRLHRVIGKNGKPVVDGVTAGRRYAPGASCPLRLDPSGPEIACARAEYAVWHASLVALVAESRKLDDHAPQHPAAPPEPWRTGEQQKPAIHRRIVEPAAAAGRLALHPPRKLALPRDGTRRNSAVRTISALKTDQSCE